MLEPSLYCPRLIEREAEMRTLCEFVAAAATGSPSIVFISGEAGIGKSRLLDELRAWSSKQAAVASVACPSFAPATLGPIYGLLDALRTAGDTIPSPADGAAGRGQLHVFQRMLDGLRAAVTLRPVVVMIDDAHWADTATLEFLKFAARALDGDRITMVVAYRSEDVDGSPDLERVIARVGRVPNVHHLSIQPLSGEAVAELIDATLGDMRRPDPSALRLVRERSEGNPLFAEELLKSTLEHESGLAPLSLRSLVSDRTAAMQPGDRHLLESAATIGRRFSATLLEKIAGEGSRPSVLAFLRLAVRQHFLVEDRKSAGWFEFRHALVREAILRPILLLESRELHYTIGLVLQREPDADERASELSEHFWQAGAKAECGRYARIAGESALARFAYREAAAEFDRALACTPGGEATLALHQGAAHAHLELGNDQAVQHYLIAAELAEASGDVEGAIAALLDASHARDLEDDFDEAARLLARAEALELAAPNPTRRFRILAQRAQGRARAGDWEIVEPAIAEAEPLLGDARAEDALRFYTGRGALRVFKYRDFQGGIEDAEAAIRCAHEIGRPSAIIVMTTNLALNVARFRPMPQTLEAFQQALNLTEGYSELYQTAVTRARYADALIDAGRLDDARALLSALLADPIQRPIVGLVAAKLVARLAVYHRDDELLKRIDVNGILERNLDENVGSWCQLASALADVHAMKGHDKAVRAVLEPFVRNADFGDDEMTSCRTLPAVGALGDREQVEAVSAAIKPWRVFENSRVRGMIALFDAYVAARFGDPKIARRRAIDACEIFESLGMPLIEAEAHVLAGNAARAALLMKSSGARRLARRLETGRAVGERAKPLSRREREIAELAAAGHSNRTIAERLFVSERTVESHLATVYSKLGVSSRAALGTAFRDVS